MEDHNFKIHEHERYKNRTLESDKPVIAYLPDIKIEYKKNGEVV